MALSDFPYTYGTQPVYDPLTDTVQENAAGGVLVGPDGNLAPIGDLNGNPITEITSNPSGMSIQFRSSVPYGQVKFGDLYVTVWSNEVVQFAINAQSAIDTANSALTLAQQALDTAAAGGTGGGTGTGGVTDHGALSGLADDDHPQYLNAARGDARYYTQAQVTSAISTANTTASAADRNRANHSGTQLAASISDFTAAVRAIVGVPTIVVRTAAQGVPTAAQAAAAGYPDGALIVVDPA